MESPQPETPTPAPTGSSAPVVQAPSGGAFTHDERELLRGIASALERLLKVVVQRHAASAMAPQKRDTSVGAAPAGARPREDGSANSSHAAMEGTAADAPLPSFAPQPAGEPSAPAAMPTIPPEPPRHRLANRGFDDARHMALKRLWRVVPPLPTVDVVRALNEVSPHLGALDKQRVANEASRLKLGARDWSASPQAQAPPPISAPAPPAPPALLAPIPPLQQQQQQQPVIIPAVAPQDADFVCVGKLLSYVQVLDIAERMGVAFTGKNLGSINRVRARNGFPPIEAAR